MFPKTPFRVGMIGLLFLVSLGLKAQPNQDVLVIEHTQPYTSLAPFLERLEDPGGQRSLTDVKALDWSVSTERVNLGFTDSAWWFRFRLANQSLQQIRMNLEIGFPQLDDVQVYIPFENVVQLGDNFNYDTRLVDARTFIVPVSLERGTHEIYVRVKTTSAFTVPLAVISPEIHIERLTREQTWLGMFYGLALALILYNLVLFVGTREPAYGMFVVASTFMALSAGVFDGMAFPFWGESLYWHNRSITFMLSGLMAALTQFMRYYLDTQHAKGWIDRFLKAWVGAWIFLLALSLLLPPGLGVRLVAPIFGLGFLALLFVAIWRWREGTVMASYFLGAAAGLIIVSLLGVLSASGIIGGFYLISLLGMKVGYALMMILLSFGQAHRIRLLKEQEASALEEVHRARAESEAKSSFLAQMSHELRTPMNAVLGIVELLRDTKLEEEQEEHLDVISTAGRSLLSVIDDILDYARLDAGKVTLCEDVFDLHETMSNCYTMFKKGVAKEGVALNFYYKRGVPYWVIGDSGRLRQVIVNLVGNALKFTHSGHVTLSVSSRGERDGVERILFEVTDTGIGISQEKARELFLAFTQADSRTAREYGGTGLGLSISSQLVTLMGGELQVQSQLGEGSRFYFTLPYETAEDPGKIIPLKKAHSNERMDFSGLKVLVAEDNRLNRRVVEGFLSRLKVKPSFAVNGQDALEMLKKERWDLALMDCEMPVIDGFEATRQLRVWEAMSGREPTLVVALTAHAMNEYRHKAEACGMNDYLPKPLIFKDLETCLCRHFASDSLGTCETG